MPTQSEWMNVADRPRISHAVRAGFQNARIDNFTSAPGQHPDTFQSLENVIVGVNSSIQRRWGTTLFANAPFQPTRIFPIRLTSSVAERFVITSTGSVAALNESGSVVTSPNPIFTPTGSVPPHASQSRDYTFFCDGVAADQLKWDGEDNPLATGSVTKWGISAPTTAERPGTIGDPVVGAGDITIDIFRKYFVAYRNSVTGGVSDFLFLGQTGALEDDNISVEPLPISIDPQVDQRVVVATSDGGSDSILYEVAIVEDNTSTSVIDNVDEPTLLSSNTWSELDAAGRLVGAYNNTPPRESAPTSTISCVHAGRVYLLQGHFFFWSKNLAEVATSTGNITGRWEECFPTQNQSAISDNGSELGTAMISDGLNLYIGTNRGVHRVYDSGNGPSPPQMVFHEVGVLNQQVWQIIWHAGKQVSTMWMTPDKRVIWSDFNTYFDAGNDTENFSSIQTTLNALGDVSGTACAAFVSDGQFEYYMLAPGTSSKNIYVYNVKTHAWVIWYNFYADPIYTMATMFDSVTNKTVLSVIGTDTNRFYKWNKDSVYDHTSETPALPVPVIQTNWLDMSNPALTKLINAVRVQTPETAMTITLEGSNYPSDDSETVSIGTRALELTQLDSLHARFADLRTKYKFYRITLGGLDTSTETDFLSYISLEWVPLHLT